MPVKGTKAGAYRSCSTRWASYVRLGIDLADSIRLWDLTEQVLDRQLPV